MPSLIGLRKYVETFNVVHKYHVRPQDQDNDLFFVVGEVDADRWDRSAQTERDTVQDEIDRFVLECRRELSTDRHAFAIAPRDFYLVRYGRTTLADVSFERRIVDVDGATFVSLYHQTQLDDR